MIFKRLVLAGLALLIASASSAAAGKRVALVIGNSAYQNVGTLDNPRNDAADLAAVLRRLDFIVISGLDLTKSGLDQKIREFAEAMDGAELGLFFYAGHGIQVGGRNYLVPVDAQLDSKSALDFELTQLNLVQRTMEREAKTNVIFLDACRDNPLARNLARSMGTRSVSIGRGLATVHAGVGTLISFSTQPGNVALDGSGRNSPFAGALISHLPTAGEDLSSVLISVRNDVIAATDGKQVPWDQHSLRGKVYLSGKRQANAPASVPSTGSPDTARAPDAGDARAEWQDVKATTSIRVLNAFRSRHRNTLYAELATVRIEELQSRQAAIKPEETRGPEPDIATLRRPIDNLFAAWRRRDADMYMAQWAPGATKLDLKSRKIKSVKKLSAERHRLFPRLRSVKSTHTAKFRGLVNGVGHFDVSYSFNIRFRSGKTFRESACESYAVREYGGRWLIQENIDYKPCR